MANRPEPTPLSRAANGSGWFDGKTFVFPVRVYYEDTDAAGLVYHANYLKYGERARSEFLRSFGTDNITLMRDVGIAFAVRYCTADFRQPAHLDDGLDVLTTVRAVRGASFLVDHLFQRGSETLVALDVRLACRSVDGRAARIPPNLRDQLISLTGTTVSRAASAAR